MIGKYYTTLGFYEPSVFHLHTLGDGKINEMNKWSDKQKSTFLHEYIHFLQDISTVQGLQNIYIGGEYLRFVTQEVFANKNIPVRTPILPRIPGQNVGANWMVKIHTMGNLSIVQRAITKRIDNTKSVTDENTGNVIQIPVIKVLCQKNATETIEIDFGTVQIMEGMAKQIQTLVYPTATSNSPYNPYYIAKDVADMVMPQISRKPRVLVALYYYALQSSNPGNAFVRYLEEKVNQGYDYNTLTKDIVYNDLRNATVNNVVMGNTSFSAAFNELGKSALDVFREYTSGIYFFRNLDVWFNHIINNGQTFALNNQSLFDDIIGGGDIVNNDAFQHMIDTFGTPLITNAVHDFGFINPKNVIITKDEITHVYAMMQIKKVFLSKGYFTCPLRKYCQNQPCGIRKQSVDVRCLKAPWERMRRWNRCKFNTWWYFKGFKNVILIR